MTHEYKTAQAYIKMIQTNTKAGTINTNEYGQETRNIISKRQERRRQRK